MKRGIASLALCAGLLWAGVAPAQVTIDWWHAMGGELGEKLEAIAEDFNARQSEYRINAVYKGNYTETMTSAIAAFRARQHPHIVQVFEVGTGSMMAATGAVYPVYKLMQDSGLEWDPSVYLPSVVGYYADTSGNMLSLPFNSSTPVMYYNKAIFQKAGLDPERPPRTWQKLEAVSQKIIDSGAAKCGFTTAWESWVQLENLSALHNVPFATKANGFGGLDTELVFNSDLHIRHIENMARWQRSGIFQ